MRDKRSVQYTGTKDPAKPSKGNPNMNGDDTSVSDETVPGPGAIAGMSPFAKQAKQCRGPVVSRSKECIELRKKMNRSQENKVTKMINKLKRNQGIQEAAPPPISGPIGPGFSTGEGDAGRLDGAQLGLDISGTNGVAGRIAGNYNAPNLQYVARNPQSGTLSTTRVHGFNTNTAGPTLTSITREMEALRIDTTSPFAVWKYANARDSSNRLNSALLALRNPEGLISDAEERPAHGLSNGETVTIAHLFRKMIDLMYMVDISISMMKNSPNHQTECLGGETTGKNAL